MHTTELEPRSLSTADLVAASERPPAEPLAPAVETTRSAAVPDDEALAPLFSDESATDFRSRWDAVQIGFVDDPAQAVRRADELVAEVMKNLAQTFARERTSLEGELDARSEGSTENLRVALRHYRSFFQRLLSL